ncbi:MAG TPA: rhomboid family intramembrane serine protease, partial [Capsulimonadaceae bacterium]|nr:rhomboid family intramembrane serine protease [Capsulimonadaceae bacterium]
MFFVLPFRAKNPPERFPYVTVGLIVMNILVYACTSYYFVQVRDSYVSDDSTSSLALSYANMTVWRFFTSMFLHENLMHLGGNMLFLWVFGSAVEGRLGHQIYASIYLFAGIIGGASQTLIFGHSNPHIASLGASGAIMGVVACYAYMFTFSTIRVFYFYWFPLFFSLAWLVPRLGVADWEAWWVVAFFFILDIVFALISSGKNDGTAHLAHYGGLLVGIAAM